MMPYVEQWKILRRAIALGWTGFPPSILGSYLADKTVEEAARFVREKEAGDGARQ